MHEGVAETFGLCTTTDTLRAWLAELAEQGVKTPQLEP